MLKWEKMGDLYVAHVDAECAYTIEHDMDTKRAGWRSTFTTADEWLLHDTLKEAQAACEDDYTRRVASIAAANGYVKLADDEVVVKRGTLNALIDDHCADCTFDSFEIHDCATCDLKPIRDRLNEVGK